MSIDRRRAAGRLRKAKAFHRVARAALELPPDEVLDRSPVMSNATLAVIAYADAVTITADGCVNQKDHASAPALLSHCLGRDLPDGRLSDFRALLSTKDEVQYGARISSPDAAAQAMNQLDRFAEWSVGWLAAKGLR